MTFFPTLIKSFSQGCLALSFVFLGACSVYKPDITQGNIITAEQMSELRLGMSRQQVAQILGSPLLQDVFNSNRWDYVYRFLKGSGALEQRVMTVFFDATGKLERWSGLLAPEQKDISLKPIVIPAIAVNQAPVDTSPAVKLNADIVALTADAAPLYSLSVPTISIAAANTTAIQAPAPNALLAATVVKSAAAAPASTLIQTSTQTRTQTENSALLSPDINLTITNKVAAWRSAWTAKDLAGYTAHYASDYKGDLSNHAAWLAQRKRVFDAAGEISVTVSDIKVIQTSSTEARAAFTQAYQSARLTETGSKNLFFERTGNEWKIIAERFVKLS